MSRVGHRRVRVLWAVVLLVAIGIASYQVGVNVWTSRQYNAAVGALARYDYPEAAQYLQRLLSFCPRDQAALMLAAQTARRQGHFDEAVRTLRLAEKQGADHDALAAERQLLRLQTGDLTNAGRMAQLCSASPGGPAAALILEALVEGSFRAFDFPPAQWGVDLWLRHHPNKFAQAHGLCWRGRLNEVNQNFEQARADYQEAVDLAPEYWPARLRLVEAWLRDDPHQAIPHLELLRRHRPEDPEVCLLTARLCRNMGQPEEAAPLLDSILASAPDKVPVLVERGRVALELNQTADAERWLMHALALAPAQREVNVAVAECLRRAGRLDEAMLYQHKAQEIAARLSRRVDEAMRGEKSKEAAYPFGPP